MKRREEGKKDFSRRDFIKTTAVGAGATALTGLGAKEAKAHEVKVPAQWDLEADVVVVGSGGGIAAAIEARDAGADVLLLEKLSKLGGSTAVCAGVVYGAGTSVQRAAGITDTPEEMYKHWMACSRGQADPEVVRAIAAKSGDTIDWLIKMGCEFPPERLYFSGPEREPYYATITPPKPRGHHQRPEPRGPLYSGYILHRHLVNGATQKGVRILLETKAVELLANEKNQVLGVKADSKGQTMSIRAKRGVILATGGFIFNRDMCEAHLRYGERHYGGGTPGATGDGILAGQMLGGNIMNMQDALRSVTTPVPIGPVNPISDAPRYPSILVNKYGRRFVNEDLHSSSTVADAAFRQDDYLVFQIFDDAVREKIEPIPQGTRAKLIIASTIRELAAKAGIDSGALEKTVNNWNAYAVGGEDPEFGKTGVTVGPIRRPPFYAFYATETIRVVATYGGLKINAKSQVITSLGKVIPRLYAVGLDAGGCMGRLYPGSGSAVCVTLNTGRIAGENAAAEAPG